VSIPASSEIGQASTGAPGRRAARCSNGCRAARRPCAADQIPASCIDRSNLGAAIDQITTKNESGLESGSPWQSGLAASGPSMQHPDQPSDEALRRGTPSKCAFSWCPRLVQFSPSIPSVPAQSVSASVRRWYYVSQSLVRGRWICFPAVSRRSSAGQGAEWRKRTMKPWAAVPGRRHGGGAAEASASSALSLMRADPARHPAEFRDWVGGRTRKRC